MPQQISLAINDTDTANAVIAARSTDQGANWQNPVVIKRDDNPTVFNDKETLTANQYDSDVVYATWQRLVFPNAPTAASLPFGSFASVGCRGHDAPHPYASGWAS